jgi:hypothetical protein
MNAGIAQAEEQLPCKQKVVSSILTAGSDFQHASHPRIPDRSSQIGFAQEMRGCHREDSGAWKPSCSTESLCFMSPEGNREISPV